MNKKRILLGILIIMAMALCGTFLLNVPSVFAEDGPIYHPEVIENEAGTFTGQGYYVVGQTATLTAQMNDGYEFEMWASVDEDGNVIAELSTELEYTFVVEDYITIVPKWHKKAYTIEFAEGLLDTATPTELKDFTSTIVNADDDGKGYLHDDEITVTLNIKSDRYIYNLTTSNIYINGVALSDLANVEASITNNADTGFSQFTVKFNIHENIVFNIDYIYMHKLTIESGNNIPISELINFIIVTPGYYSKLDDFNYLVRDDKEINLSITEGNSVYTFVRHKFQNQEYSREAKQTFRLITNSTFVVEYEKEGYDITFNPYITNTYGGYDLLEDALYTIAPITLTAGESITFAHDDTTKRITINSTVYEYNPDIYGYSFVGFAINGQAVADSYTLSATEPANVEIQIIFEYIEYTLDLQLVDDFFSDDVDYGYNLIGGTQIIKGAKISLYATSTKYNINGWSLKSNPHADDYLQSNEIIFEPTGDDVEHLTYTIYLDVDYYYYSTQYKLNESNIEPGATAGEYVYYGQISASIIEELTIAEDGGNTIVNLIGTKYSEGTTTADCTIQTFNSTTTHNAENNSYKIDSFPYEMILYMNAEGTAYSHISLRGVTYYYDTTEDKFVLRYATINTPNPVECVFDKSDKYSITLSNLLTNTLVVYQTQTIDAYNYLFISFKDGTGSNLWSYDYAGAQTCIADATSFEQVVAGYRKLSNDIYLNIANVNAYQYENIQFTIDAGEPSTGNEIEATNGQVIVITIDEELIGKGYRFIGYYLDANCLGTEVELEITMSNAYINKTIEIAFEEIEYTINFHYIDDAGSIIEAKNAYGKLELQGHAELPSSLVATIGGTYNFTATANKGHYVGNAYFGSNAYSIASLIGNNASTQTVTTWTLSALNFVEAVINNASIDTQEVNLYINFTKHTYNIKIYFDIDQYASSITYPSLYINNIKHPITRAEEDSGSGTVIRYFVIASGYEYETDVALRLESFMQGTTLKKWKDASGSEITTQLEHRITKITANTTLTAELQYISYSVEYIVVDESGEQCKYGRVSSGSNSVMMFDTINYSADPNDGYVLQEKYAYNAAGEKVTTGLDSGFQFAPANFKIESGSKVKLYFAFAVKRIQLNLSNTVSGGLYNFEEQDASTLATYTIVRDRGGEKVGLDETTGYEVQTNDSVVVEIRPISIGIELYHVKLADTTISMVSKAPYQLTAVDILDGQDVIGVHYILQIEFTPSVISALNNTTDLTNVLRIRTYNISYTYNFINSQFGITLIRQYNGSTAYGDPDEQLDINGVGFGSTVRFSYVYEGMNSEIGNKFKINGFNVNGIKQESNDGYTLEDVELWEQIALSKYIEGGNAISVVLLLAPKITLANATAYSPDTGYLYERVYIGENQGLTATGERADIVVGGNFDVVIKYNIGAGFSDSQPINVGEYPVQIIAKITADGMPTIDVQFDEPVTYKITPASITIGFKTYSYETPLTKTYDGTSALAAAVLINDFALNGLYEIDQDKVFVDANRLSAQLSGSAVNSLNSLYDVSVFDIFLLNKANQPVTNYVLSSGQNLVFTGIAKINPKPLYITGFKVSNKVYDGTDSVPVDVSGILFEGKLETDSTEIFTESLEFYLDNYSVGHSREVLVDWSTALSGADSVNYSITYEKKYIDIHPYELTYTTDSFGTFKVVDVDKLCLIPIESELIVNVYEKGSAQYREMYARVEGDVDRRERLKVCYEVAMRINYVKQFVPQGLYVYLPKVANTSKVVQLLNEEQKEIKEHSSQKSYTVVKVDQGKGEFAIVTQRTYLPLWMIILIVIASATAIGIAVFVFILIRRKRKSKYSAYDKI